jgi:hypothetical protein
MRKQIVPVSILDRMMQMPAGRGDMRQLRPTHETREITGAREDLLGCAAEQQHQIGWLHAGRGTECDLELARPEFDLQ